MYDLFSFHVIYNMGWFPFITDHDLDDLEMQVVRTKPEGLDALCSKTKFSKKELQVMYRGFKQVIMIIHIIIIIIIIIV